MLKRKIPKNAVIRAQKEVIQAQNVLIEWLLRKVELRPRTIDPAASKDR
jgi:hypothetical protein